MANITVKMVAVQMLNYIGIRQLAPEDPAAQLETVQPGDLDAVASAITGAMQEVFESAPDEMREQRIGGVLRASTSQTATVTQYSTVISALTGYQSYMLGCTVRLAGDPQDNELISATALANPYMGPSASNIQITIYNDCITLADNVDHVTEPVSLPNQIPLHQAKTRLDYLWWAGAPLLTMQGGTPYTMFPVFFQRTIARPRAWFAEGYYDSTLAQYKKRLRFAPMPDAAYPVNYRAAMTPPRYSATDIDNGDHTTDPGTLIPVSNGWVESILLPVALQRFTAHPAFKNEASKAEIARQYKQALGLLTNSQISRDAPNIRYI